MCELRKSRQSQGFLEQRILHSILMSTCFICSISIALHTKLLSHDPDRFCCVQLPSRDAKSMLTVATFLKMAVVTFERCKSRDTISFVKLYNTVQTQDSICTLSGVRVMHTTLGFGINSLINIRKSSCP